METWASHVTAERVLERVLDGLASAGVVAMPVKGILTAHLLYEDVASRPIVDIDLRVSRQDFPRVVRLVRERQWNPRLDSPHLGEVRFEVDDWELDVESTVSDPGLCRIPVATMISRATTRREPLAFQHLEPELHDHALILVLNAFKDGLGAPPWAIQDVLRIAEQPGFDVGRFVQLAQEGGVCGATWIVSEWLAREHGSKTWRRVCEHGGMQRPAPRVRGPYRFLRDRGWPTRLGALLTASSNDSPVQSAIGLGLTLGGIVKGRLNRGAPG